MFATDQTFQDLQWIYEVRKDRFKDAGAVFNRMAEGEGRLDRLTTIKSLEKLACVAAGFSGSGGVDGSDADPTVQDATEALKLINFQQELPGSTPSSRPLKAAELVEAHVQIEQGTAPLDVDFLASRSLGR